MRKCRLLALVLLAAAVLTLFSGCWDYYEITDQSIVAGISIDKGTQPGRLKYGFEILPMPAGQKESFKPVAMADEGVTIEEAMNNITEKISNHPYVDHAWIMLFSADIARDGIRDIIELCIMHPNLYSAIYPAVVKSGPAFDVLSCKQIISPILSYGITGGFESENKYIAKVNTVYAYEIFGMLGDAHAAYVLPAITITEENDTRIADDDGGAVFRQDRLIGFLTPEEVQYFKIAAGDIKGAILAFDDQEELRALKLRKCKTRLSVSWNGDAPAFTIKTELSVSTKSLPDKYDLAMYGELYSGLIEKKISALVRKAQEMGCDILRFSQHLDRYCHSRWEKIKSGWDAAFPSVGCVVDVNVSILD